MGRYLDYERLWRQTLQQEGVAPGGRNILVVVVAAVVLLGLLVLVL
jgi:hypothetical protein